MKKAKEDKEKLTYKDGFYLHVDGNKYGPFLAKHRPQYKDLNHRAGVSFEPVRLSRGWIEPPPPPKRTKPDKSTPLLDGTDFMPVNKTLEWWKQ